jgi:hypothetical protein
VPSKALALLLGLTGVTLLALPALSEQFAELIIGKQVEQNRHVHLFHELVVVGAIVLCLEDEIEAVRSPNSSAELPVCFD